MIPIDRVAMLDAINRRCTYVLRDCARRIAIGRRNARQVLETCWSILATRIYRPKKRHTPFKYWAIKWGETIAKCLVILALASIPAYVVARLWHDLLFVRHLHFDKEVREILIAAWIPAFGVIYALLAGVAVNWVATEYKEMRMAVKRRDIERFMILQDEDLSPLMHSMVSIIAFAVLGGFMGIEYPNAETGMFIVGGAAYVFSLLCIVVIEIDDPCSGFWFIKNIPPEWIAMNPKEWRDAKFKVTLTETTSVTVEAERPLADAA